MHISCRLVHCVIKKNLGGLRRSSLLENNFAVRGGGVLGLCEGPGQGLVRRVDDPLQLLEALGLVCPKERTGQRWGAAKRQRGGGGEE